MTDRQKPGVAFWATVVVVAVLLAYPLSQVLSHHSRQHIVAPSRRRSDEQAYGFCGIRGLRHGERHCRKRYGASD